MGFLLFLDIDGVLNDSAFLNRLGQQNPVMKVVDGRWDGTEHIDPVRVERLNRILAVTQTKVVLSSSWRQLFGSEHTEQMLRTQGFSGNLAGETPRIYGVARGVEIQTWLTNQSYEQFVILDDDPGAGIGLDKNFVHVPDGLEDHHVQQAIDILNSHWALLWEKEMKMVRTNCMLAWLLINTSATLFDCSGCSGTVPLNVYLNIATNRTR
jgi:hypothetical protein